MIRTFILAAASAAAVSAAAPAAAAVTTVLDFSGAICGVGGGEVCANGSSVATAYGSTADVDVVWSDRVGPGDSAQFTDHVLYWDTDYGDLIGNVWTNSGAVGQAVLTLATPGKTLTLDSLKGGGWFRSDRPVGVRVYALDWTPLFNSELVFPGTGHLDVAFGLSTTTGFILQWGPDSFNGGIDDLTFTVDAGGSAVPEPSSWALMIAGFGVTGAAMRRRKAALA